MKKRLLALITSSAFIATVFTNPLPANAVGENDELVLTVDLQYYSFENKLQLHFDGPTENLSIDWGDGNPAIPYDNNDGIFTYGTNATGERTVTVTSSSQSSRFTFGKGYSIMSGNQLIVSVDELPVWIDKYSGSFLGASNLETVPAELPLENVDGVDQSVVTSTSRMFQRATQFNDDVSAWDTSRVTDMSSMFEGASDFNSDISSWDTSQVIEMSGMLNGASSFAQDIGSWNTSSVEDMSYLFKDTDFFNADISSWDTSKVDNMNYMFSGADAFNADISSWDTSSVINMSQMFAGADSFNIDIDYDAAEGYWDTSSVADMSYMFINTDKFEQDLSNWNTESVKNMKGMFAGSKSFDGDIGNWNVSSVEDMELMFENSKFNRDISSWNTSKVKYMKAMFKDTTAFDQNLNNWDVSSVTDMENMFQNAQVFNGAIGSWDVSSVETFEEMFNDAHAFNQPINDWNVSSADNMEEMFFDARSFNQDLNSWDVSMVTDMEDMFKKAAAFNGNIADWDTSAVEKFQDMFEDATNFNVYIGDWNTGSATSTTNMFKNSGFTFCLPESFFPVIDVIQTDYETLGLSDLSADPPVDFSSTCKTYVPPAPARPYYGPISRPLAQTEAIAGEEVKVSGFRLDVVERVTVGDQQLEIVSKESSALVLMVPENLSGMVSLGLHWRNGERTGTYRVFEALSVSQPEVEETPQPESSSNQKINAGSFKGFVAVYALGYEGQRLSAKIGNDWVIVDPIVNNETESLARIVDFTGAGVDINLKVYIDRQLVMTVPLTTK